MRCSILRGLVVFGGLGCVVSCQAVTGGDTRDLEPRCVVVSDCLDEDACTIEHCLDGRCQYENMADPGTDSDGDELTCLLGDCDDTDPLVRPGLSDVCDGRNNDCDGETDEDAVGAGDPCTTDELGECSEGEMACVGGEMICQHLVEPTEERCNGLDDDCDGEVDDDCHGGCEGGCEPGEEDYRDSEVLTPFKGRQ